MQSNLELRHLQKITWHPFACVFNALTHMIKHPRFDLAQAVVLHGKFFCCLGRYQTEDFFMFREAAFGGQYVQEAMKSTVHHGTCGRALSSLGTIVVPNGQQRWFLTPSEESAASDTRSSLL